MTYLLPNDSTTNNYEQNTFAKHHLCLFTSIKNVFLASNFLPQTTDSFRNTSKFTNEGQWEKTGFFVFIGVASEAQCKLNKVAHCSKFPSITLKVWQRVISLIANTMKTSRFLLNKGCFSFSDSAGLTGQKLS